MDEGVEVATDGVSVMGITFVGSDEHTLNITAREATVQHCRFLGGKDQLSITGGGGHIAHCYFENAGDDAIDCDESVSWVIEHNTIVNAHQDGIEVRLHKKQAPLTMHTCRYNTISNSGQSGIQLIDYQGNSFREFHIHNNRFLHCRGAGVSCMYQEKDNTNEVYRGSLMEEKAYVYGNTFDGCNCGLTLAPHLIVLNNVFRQIKTRGIERGAYLTDATDQSVVDFSLFYANGQHFGPGVNTGSHLILDRDPLLGANHEPLPGSPCIDAGTAEYKWNDHTLQIPATCYQGAAPDLGAVESAPSQ